jgi:hypothetical protein
VAHNNCLQGTNQASPFFAQRAKSAKKGLTCFAHEAGVNAPFRAIAQSKIEYTQRRLIAQSRPSSPLQLLLVGVCFFNYSIFHF